MQNNDDSEDFIKHYINELSDKDIHHMCAEIYLNNIKRGKSMLMIARHSLMLKIILSGKN